VNQPALLTDEEYQQQLAVVSDAVRRLRLAPLEAMQSYIDVHQTMATGDDWDVQMLADDGYVLELAERLLAAVDRAGPRDFDRHPEDYCHRCGGRNMGSYWSTPSPLWSQVMRGGSSNGRAEFNGIVCPICFAELAEIQGVATGWRLTAVDVHVELETVTPSGHVWNPETWMFDEPVWSDPGRVITDAINADPAEVARLRRARDEARVGRRGVPLLTAFADEAPNVEALQALAVEALHDLGHANEKIRDLGGYIALLLESHDGLAAELTESLGVIASAYLVVAEALGESRVNVTEVVDPADLLAAVGRLVAERNELDATVARLHAAITGPTADPPDDLDNTLAKLDTAGLVALLKAERRNASETREKLAELGGRRTTQSDVILRAERDDFAARLKAAADRGES